MKKTDLSTDTYARIAGVFYLLIIVIFLSGDFILSGIADADSFLDKAVQASSQENLYRFGLSLKLLSSILTVVLAFSLYKTIEPYNNGMSKMALYWRLGESTIGCVHAVFAFLTLFLYSNVSDGTFEKNQLEAMTVLTKGGYWVIFNASTLLFCFGSTLYFYLFLKSRFIPVWISILGIFASVLVLFTSFGGLIFPDYGSIIQYGFIPMFISEIVTGFWLTFKGVDLSSLNTTASKPAAIE